MVFVINTPSIMSIIVITILHGIPLMDTHLAMILIKTKKLESEEKNSPASSEIPEQLQDAPEQVQKT